MTAELNLQQPVPRFLKNHLNMLIWWLVIINYYLHSYSHNTGFSLLTFKCCKVVTWILKCVSPRILLSQIWGTTFIDIKSHRVRSMHLHEVLINRKNFNNCLVPSGQNKTDLPCSQWSCWPAHRRTLSVNQPSRQTKIRHSVFYWVLYAQYVLRRVIQNKCSTENINQEDVLHLAFRNKSCDAPTVKPRQQESLKN